MIVYLVIMCLTTGLIIISNLMSLVLLIYISFDDYNALQGVDYCIFSMIISDLISAFVLNPLSIASRISNNRWISGVETCKATGYISYTLFAVNANSLFWMSVDRYKFIIDVKYSSYKMRTRARCICELIFTWIISALYSIPPLMTDQSVIYLAEPSVCRINWHNLQVYYLSVVCVLFLPSIVATFSILAKIFILRAKYSIGCYNLKGSMAEALLEPTHRMTLILVLLFWLSWTPYSIHLLLECQKIKINFLSFWDVWIGVSQSIWKLPIMIGFCPRYRGYFLDMMKFDCCQCKSFKTVHALNLDAHKNEIEMHM